MMLRELAQLGNFLLINIDTFLVEITANNNLSRKKDKHQIPIKQASLSSVVLSTGTYSPPKQDEINHTITIFP
jgi:hypothetical protein